MERENNFFDKIAATKFFGFFLNSGNVLQLILKSILLLLIPYAYLFLCGLLFDKLLNWYFMTPFIAISLFVFWAIAIALIVWAIIRYAKKPRK